MAANIEDFPPEVYEAMAISMHKYVGEVQYKRFLEIVEKYPEHFPQEYTYHFVVPEEVHEKHRRALEIITRSFYPPKKYNKGGGVFSQIQEVYVYKPSKEGFDEAVKSWGEKIEKEAQFNKAKKKLWNKYYKEYGIKYS